MILCYIHSIWVPTHDNKLAAGHGLVQLLFAGSLETSSSAAKDLPECPTPLRVTNHPSLSPRKLPLLTASF